MNHRPRWLAVDIGGSSIKVALWDGYRLTGQQRTNFGKTVVNGEWIADLLQTSLQGWGNPPIRAAAVGVPALVSPDHHVVRESANLGWRDYPLAPVLRRTLHVPVILDTDIVFAAGAEAAIGAGKQCDDFVYLNLGTGISHVRMLRQQPQLGAHGLGMNLGHAPLFSGHPASRCACGRPCCVERILGGRAVTAALRRLSGQKLGQFWRAYGNHLGIVLAILVSLLDPERIVLNGGVCASRAAFEPSLRAALRRHTLHRGHLPSIRFSRLGDTAGLLGTGLAAQKLSHNS